MDSRNRRRPQLPLSIRTLMGLVLGGAALLTGCQPQDSSQGGRGGAGQEPAKQAPVAADRLTSQSQVARDQANAEQVQRQQAARQRGWSEGHGATVACLHGERAQTDGNELRCEDQIYVRQNYARAASR